MHESEEDALKSALVDKEERQRETTASMPKDRAENQLDAYAFVRKKCKDTGVTPEEYNAIFERFDESAATRYSSSEYANDDWLYWKIHSQVWGYFFPTILFPKKMPAYRSKIQPLPDRISTPSSPYRGKVLRDILRPTSPVCSPRKITASIKLESSTLANLSNGLEASMHRLIDDELLSLGIDKGIYRKATEEKRQIVENKFPSESDEWLEWYAESLVWGCFFENSPFPRKEPSRIFPLRSSIDTFEAKIQIPTTSSGNKWIKTPLERERAPMHHTGSGRFPRSVSSNGILPTGVPNTDQPRLYAGLEGVMEDKAKRCHQRREFFQCLQKNRDHSRTHHKDCNPQYRAWLADSMTWKCFFHPEPFPGVEPKGKGVHAAKCVDSTPLDQKGMKVNAQSTREISAYGDSGYISNRDTTRLSKDRRAQIPNFRREEASRDKDRLLLFGAYKTAFDCSDYEVKQLAYVMLVNSQKITFEEFHGCQIKVHERRRDYGDGLTIQLSPLNNVGTKVFEDATNYISDWIKSTLYGRNPPQFYTFWNQYAGAKQLISDSTQTEKRKCMVNATTQTEVCVVPGFYSSVALGDPEYEWEQYSKAFGATEVDRILMEERVKIEGQLRLVLDQQTQEVIGLREFEERVKLRFSGTMLAGKPEYGVLISVERDTVTPKEKRKAEEVEEGEPYLRIRSEKRVRV